MLTRYTYILEDLEVILNQQIETRDALEMTLMNNYEEITQKAYPLTFDKCKQVIQTTEQLINQIEDIIWDIQKDMDNYD